MKELPLTTFLTSVLDGGKWLASMSDLSTQRKETQSYLHINQNQYTVTGQEAAWATKTIQTLWWKEKSCYSGNQTLVFQPLALWLQ